MSRILLFNKPFQVLSQFTDTDGRKTLSDYISQPNFYACGRLDKDSEGLLVLTDDGKLQHKISHPSHKLKKTYWVQVEGIVDASAINQLRKGVLLKDGLTQPAEVKLIDQPDLWVRTPPVRYRKLIPDCWLQISISEGRNRQIRRMTAAIGHPTLRLVRCSIGQWGLHQLQPGEWEFSQT